jgi:hypothetical protein
VFDRVENVFQQYPLTQEMLKQIASLLKLYGNYYFLKDKTNFKPPGAGL